MKQRGFLDGWNRPISSLDLFPDDRLGFARALRRISDRLVSTAHERLPRNGRRSATRAFDARADADVLIVVPPFASLYIPSLAAHTLQACAGAVGVRVHVLYANVLLAAWIGERAYNQVAWQPIGPLAAERLFARWAFDMPPLGRNAGDMFELHRMFGDKQARIYAASLGLVPGKPQAAYSRYGRSAVRRLERSEARLGEWLDDVVGAVVARQYRIVGCTTTFEQTVCSVALLDRIKKRRPGTVTIIGGANCEGDMAQGILSLGAGIDYIFSGESDETFPAFVRDLLDGRRPAEPIVSGRPCEDMNARPTPRFHEFFDQRERYLSRSRRSNSQTYITYETSRGCWWGAKQHCTFCGLNGEGMASRRKSAERVLEELRALTAEHPTRHIGMTDNIMPHEYFKTLLPKMSGEVPRLNIFYEQKANMSVAQVFALKEAGITTIQPGIESLSSSMLRLMKKGVQAWQNLQLLRNGRMAGIQMLWAILCGFPGDDRAIYEENLRIVRLIHHLPPASALWHLSIDRFSPYFMRPDQFGVKNVVPYPAYRDVFPASADAAKLAYHFIGEYDSAADVHLDLMHDLGQEIRAWRAAWERPYAKRPELKIERDGDADVLIDTRGLPGTAPRRPLAPGEAAFLLWHRQADGSERQRTAVAEKLAVIVDGWFVPLPVTRIDYLFDIIAGQPETDGQRAQLEELGMRRCREDARAGLVRIACDGGVSALVHPLAP